MQGQTLISIDGKIKQVLDEIKGLREDIQKLSVILIRNSGGSVCETCEVLESCLFCEKIKSGI